MERLTPEERAAEKVFRTGRRRVLKANRAARPKKIAPLRSAKPDSALRERRSRVRDNAYLAFVRRLPCIACARKGQIQSTPTEAAHIRSAYPEPGWSYTGKAEKPDDWRTAPLCADHHQHGPEAQHKANETAWWAALHLYPPAVCARLRQAYDGQEDGAQVIAEIARWEADRV